jgi:hypothetical protein
MAERITLKFSDATEELQHKLRVSEAILEVRERELLELKGPCSTCRLHYAHSGPCDTRERRG